MQVTAINVTPGGCCHWHIVASIKKSPGDGKNAIAALLSIADIKYVVVTDDDIDIFDPVEVEWAVATRVQADRDTVILSNARSKPLDPSIPPSANGVPTTAKMGIDATIPENVPRYRYNRIVYHNQGKAVLDDYLGESPAAPATGGRRRRRHRTVGGTNALAMLRGEAADLQRTAGRVFGPRVRHRDGAGRDASTNAKRITLDEEGKYMPAEEA